MKKLFQSGKIWTVMSAIIFLMTCGIVVYAVSVTGTTPFSNRKKTSDGVLTYQEWNAIMDNLDSLNVEGGDDSIPAGAIMAFNRSCPSGRTRLSDADGKFLQGSSSYSTNGGYGRGSSTHTLTISEMPSHSHLVVKEYSAGTSEHWLEDSSIDPASRAITSSTLRDDDSDYSMKVVVGSADAGKSSSVGGGSSFNIMNPYIKVVYCVKN